MHQWLGIWIHNLYPYVLANLAATEENWLDSISAVQASMYVHVIGHRSGIREHYPPLLRSKGQKRSCQRLLAGRIVFVLHPLTDCWDSIIYLTINGVGISSMMINIEMNYIASMVDITGYYHQLVIACCFVSHLGWLVGEGLPLWVTRRVDSRWFSLQRNEWNVHEKTSPQITTWLQHVYVDSMCRRRWTTPNDVLLHEVLFHDWHSRHIVVVKGFDRKAKDLIRSIRSFGLNIWQCWTSVMVEAACEHTVNGVLLITSRRARRGGSTHQGSLTGTRPRRKGRLGGAQGMASWVKLRMRVDPPNKIASRESSTRLWGKIWGQGVVELHLWHPQISDSWKEVGSAIAAKLVLFSTPR